MPLVEYIAREVLVFKLSTVKAVENKKDRYYSFPYVKLTSV
jgi:hypothetical protein